MVVKRRQGGCRLQPLEVNGLRPEIAMIVGSRHCQAEGRQKRSSRKGETMDTHRARRRRHVSSDLKGTWESQGSSRKEIMVCSNKPVDGKKLQREPWQSDQSILVKKLGNASGAKGLAAISREDRDTSSTLRGGSRKSTKLFSLSSRARENPQLKFTSLAHLITVDFLRECFWQLKRNKAPGVDGVRVKKYGENLEENLKDLVEKLKAKEYRPRPVRRVYIPKPKGKKRPLGIPTVEDKIVQMALKRILEPIFEADFLDVSFGFRPQRNAHQALDCLDKTIMRRPVNYIVDMDIEKFFDTVNHCRVMQLVRTRIVDSTILRLIGRFLRAGVMEKGKYYQVDKGTPQGGILSPLLANIYLHYCLDLWFQRKIKKQNRGYSKLIRYADDYVVCFQAEREAKEFTQRLRERLGRFGLRVSEKKSRMIPFGRYPYYDAQKKGGRIATFDFLGFTHYCTKSRRGYFKLGRKTAKTKFRLRTKELNEWLRHVRNLIELQLWWPILKLKLRGHYQYYGISGNMLTIVAFYQQVRKLAFKWINKRSQRKTWNWIQFQRYLKYNPLPKPKIYHLTYTLSSGRA